MLSRHYALAADHWRAGLAGPPAMQAVLLDMSHDNGHGPIEVDLQRLEVRINELLSLVQQLNEENRALRHRQDHLASERATLLQKNEQARAGVEAMIGRLRLLENGV